MTAQPADRADVKATIRQYWGDQAAGFDQGATHGLLNDAQSGAWRALIRAWGGPATLSTLDVLDIGCGTGFLALLFAELGHRVVGIDAAPPMLEQARTKASAAGLNVDFQLGDVEQIARPAASFDLVVERHVLWTLPDPAVALKEWARLLRPGGRVILVEGDWRTTGGSGYDEETRAALPLCGGRPSAELAPWVSQAGFIDIRVEPLSDGAFWGGAPDRERYALHARVPT